MFRQMSLFLSERQAIPPTIKVPCLIISMLQVEHCCIKHCAQDRKGMTAYVTFSNTATSRTWLSAQEEHLQNTVQTER